MFAVIHTGRTIETGDFAAAAYRDDCIELCERHGFSASNVMRIEYAPRGLRKGSLRFDVLLRDEKGNARLACDHERKVLGPDEIVALGGEHRCEIAMAVKERRLIGALPDWWKPE